MSYKSVPSRAYAFTGGASDTQMGFLIGLTFAIFYAILGMPIAMLADRTNRRNIIALATTIWTELGRSYVLAFKGKALWSQFTEGISRFKPVT